tara:strand:- start:94 stop:552 length:459 start_codon:yes stop_codon:yes gene_type:complete
MQTAHTSNGKILLSIIKKKENEDRNYNNNYALSQVDLLKGMYPNDMVWFKPVGKHFFFLVVCPERREIMTSLNRVMNGGIPLSGDEYNEFLSELQDLIGEPPNWFKRWEDSQVGTIEYSIERFLEENTELSDKVSLDLHLEDERFYDSPIWD